MCRSGTTALASRRVLEDMGMDDVVNRFARELADAIAADETAEPVE